MNILILVFTMLSLLTIMTYTRLQTFLDDSGIRIEYEAYMMATERVGIDDIEERKYKNAVPKGGSSKSADDIAEVEKGYAMLNILPLLKKPEAVADQTNASGKVGQVTTILDRLINILYGKQTFFVEASKDYPNLSEKIVSAMVQAAADPICGLKFTHIRDLANLVFADEKLREVFYKMLKGEEPDYRKDSKGKDVMTSAGYPSLLGYLSVNKRATTIRVWLARKALLQAIFRDPQEIIDRRNELYKYLKDDIYTSKAANDDFARFRDPIATDVELTLLDFKTSKTRPPSD